MTRRAPFLAGGLLMALVAVNAAHDIAQGARHWDMYGPLARAPLPSFRMSMVDGGRLTDRELQGQVTVLSFWASWCGVCRSEMPMFQSLHQQFSDHADARVVLVNHEGRGTSTEDARAISRRVREQRGLAMPLAIDDGGLYERLRASVLPHTVVVDRNGIVRHVHPGRVMQSTLEAEVQALLGE